MHAVAFTLVLAMAAPVEAPASEQAKAEAPSAQRAWGVGLLAGGSALLAVTATGAALMEAVTRPDDSGDEVAHPEVLQLITFGSMVLGAVAIGTMVAGGALVVAE